MHNMVKGKFQSRFASYPKDESPEEAERFSKRLQEIMEEIGDRSFRDYETPKGVAFVFREGEDAEQPCPDCGQVHGKSGHTSDAIKNLVASLGASGAGVAVLTGNDLASMLGGGGPSNPEDDLLSELSSSFRSLPPGVREEATKAAFNRKAAGMTHEQVSALHKRAETTLTRASKEANPPDGFLEYLKLIINLCEGKQAFAMS